MLAPLVAELEGVKLPVCSCSQQEAFLEAIRAHRPDAVILSATSLLPDLCDALVEMRKTPLVLAFHEPSGHQLDLTGVICYIDDYAAVARTLVDCLSVPLPEYHSDFLRVPGRLKM